MEETSIYKCRFCGEPLHVIIQPALVKGRLPSTLVTCENSKCDDIYGHTISVDRHYNDDLSIYKRKAKVSVG